jgi:hypothetical protein
MNELAASSNLYFTNANCTGDEYMIWESGIQPQAHRVGTDVWYADTTAIPAPLSPGSRRNADSGFCDNSVGAIGSAVPAFNFTLPTYTPPFHLEPEACYTPPSAVAALTPYGLGALALVLAFGAYVFGTRRFATVGID